MKTTISILSVGLMLFGPSFAGTEGGTHAQSAGLTAQTSSAVQNPVNPAAGPRAVELLHFLSAFNTGRTISS